MSSSRMSSSTAMPDDSEPTALRRLSVWSWPAAAIVVIAVAGQVFGLLGSIIAASAACCAVLFSAVEFLDNGGYSSRRQDMRRRFIAVLAFTATVGVITLFTSQGAVPWSRPAPSNTAADGPVDLRGKQVIQAQVSEDDLRGALLAGADLSALDLRSRNLDGASAPGAVLRGANLAGASLQRVDLRGADLTRACLAGADLRGAVLDGADRTGTNLTGATTANPAPPESTSTTKPNPAPTCPPTS